MALTVMGMGVLMVQFSELPDWQREEFIRQHTELLTPALLDWAQ